MYANGRGVPKDYNEAIKLYRLAAAQGLRVAQISLGSMYASGHGVPQDYVLSYMWLTIAKSNRTANLFKSVASKGLRIGAQDGSNASRKPSDHRPSRNISGSAVRNRDPPNGDYFQKPQAI